MKKIFKTMLAVAIAAFTFTSCEDVPEPYQIPGMGNDDPNTEIIGGEGDGTEASPYNITSVTTIGTGTNVYVKGFIVGYISGKSFDDAVIGADTCTVLTNLLLASTATETNKSKCIPVQLPTGVIRSGLNLSQNKGNLGKEVVLCGNIEKYFGQTGVKNVVYATIDGQEIGNKPGVGPAGEPTGDGTLENPFNSVAANLYATSLGADVESDKEIYVKGKIVSVVEEFGTQYGNATFYISDNGTSTDQFYVYRTLYLGNKKYTGGDNIKAGDEVVICGKVVNYMGNTPETATNKSYIYSLNGKTADGGTPDTPADGATGDGTQANPYNSIAANKVASALSDTETTDVVYIKGKVATIRAQYGTQYGNATFTISDDGTTNGEFLVYRALYLNNVKYTEGEVLHVGDDVVVCGKLCNYMGNTPETVTGEAYLYSLTCNGGTEEPENPGTTTPDEGSLLSNGTFEAWSNGLPVNWKTASTAGNATLSQSTDAHSGKYSVSVGYVTSSNKRLGYKETELEAGKYKFTFWAKATKGGKSQTRAGYTPVVDGKVGQYVYGDYASLSTSWTEVTYEFELTEKTTICLVIMNPKNSSYSESQEILVDDAKLVKM